MGTMLQAANLTLDDFEGHEGCNEILNVTRPDVVRSVHDAYFAVGVDCVETNTFGANWANLGEYGIADRIGELSAAGARLAREVADGWSTPDRPRWVLGSVGPGTKLPSLGHVRFDVLRDAYRTQVEGMVGGGVDAVLVETAQDLLQAKAAVIGARRAMKAAGVGLPLLVNVTVETTGTMLLGTEIGAALTALEPLGVDYVGLNCATGPAEMSEHLRHLARHARAGLSCMPNAGLPQLTADGAHYPLTPRQLADAHDRFTAEYGLALVGGCCGTTPEHLRQVVERVHGREVTARKLRAEPGVSSLYQHVPFRQDTSYLAIGERTNANGSRAFRDAMLEQRFDDCVEIARSQTRDGSHLLDLCVDYVGRDGVEDMRAVASRFATASTLPTVLDSTEPAVVEAGLECLGGRSVVNSVNYEDGDGPQSRFAKTTGIAVEHGAALIALTIDEQGQARTPEHKVAVAERLIADLTGNWGVRESDIIIDCLTFTIATGQEESRGDGVATIEAIRELKRRHPDVQTTLGLSNISFGLNPAARAVLNSAFLHECVKAGLDSAIVHAARILPIARIPEEQYRVALDLIYDRRRPADGDRPAYDPLARFLELFEGVDASSAAQSRAAELAGLPLFERLERRIVDGERNGLTDDLDEALTRRPALDIVNDTLLPGMRTVGELFGSGQMQLPFVLQSAEVMKAAVAHLEPHMERVEGDDSGKGTIVLATVKGDVHDIGKNLVDIILSNNGYTVVNLGIKQPISTIIDAAEESAADAIGMSGLLVKSTVVMKENLRGDEPARPGRPLAGAARRCCPDPGLRRGRSCLALRGRGPLRTRRVRGPAAHGRRGVREAGPADVPGRRAAGAAQAPRVASIEGGRTGRSGRPALRRGHGQSGADAAVLGQSGGSRAAPGRLCGVPRRAGDVPGPMGAARDAGWPVLRGAGRDRGPAAVAAVAGSPAHRRASWKLPSSTATGPRSPRATTSWSSPLTITRRRSRGSPSRGSAATGGCAWPTSSGPASPASSTSWRSTW